MTSSSPHFAVIIPTLDRPEALRGCLEALAAQSYPHGRFEVIVVDDGGHASLETTVAAVRDRLEVRLARQENQGAAAARNAGARQTEAPFYAFVDDDCRPAPDWLERFAARIERNPQVLYGGRTVNALEANACAAASQLILERAYAYHNPDPDDARFFATNNMVVPAEGFRRVGGFDAGFRVASEDREFCARWRDVGLGMVSAPEALVYHAHHLTFIGFWKQHFSYGRGAWRYHAALRERGRGQFLRNLPFHGQFVARALGALRDQGGSVGLRVGALLIVWQVANAAGFLAEAVSRKTDGA